MSMLTEATATGKPVFVFDLADPRIEPAQWPGVGIPSRPGPGATAATPRRDGHPPGHLEAGRAVPLGQPWPEGSKRGAPADAEIAAERLRALFPACRGMLSAARRCG